MKTRKKRGPGRPKGSKNVDVPTFIKAWQRSDSAVEVGEKFNRTARSVSTYAVRLRKRGIKLKHMKRGGGRGNPGYSPADIREWRKLAASLEK